MGARKRKANELSRVAVAKEIARHNPVMIFTDAGPRHFCTVCWLMWPCPTVENLQAAEEAISVWAKGS